MHNTLPEILFSDYVEKINEKNLTWEKKWLVVHQGRLLFYEKRPSK